jgi:hypothetical protein
MMVFVNGQFLPENQALHPRTAAVSETSRSIVRPHLQAHDRKEIS